ncbi:hypothetical protein RV08_GL000996 [Enterococcus mundtii]|nr:hypothetical protein RV08_GL000996 [Enterococcus mundtii]
MNLPPLSLFFAIVNACFKLENKEASKNQKIIASVEQIEQSMKGE